MARGALAALRARRQWLEETARIFGRTGRSARPSARDR